MEIAIIALCAVGLVFAVVGLNQARPKVVAERVAGHPDTFELWNPGPNPAVVVRAEVRSPGFHQGLSLDDATAAIPGVSIDDRIRRDGDRWGRGAVLEPLRRYEVRLPAAATLRLVYRAQGVIGSLATATLVVEGSHRSDPASATADVG